MTGRRREEERRRRKEEEEEQQVLFSKQRRPDYKASFPKWPPRGWAQIRNTKQQVGTDGIDLLENLMCYAPTRRLSACRALQHTYFRDVDMLALE